MSNIREIETKRIDQHTIGMLENIIEEAKQGRVIEFCATYIDHEYKTVSCYSGSCGDVYKMVGALEVTKLEYVELNVLANRKKV